MFLWGHLSTPLKVSFSIVIITISLNLTFFSVYSNDLSLIFEWNILNLSTLSFNLPVIIDKTSVIFSSSVLTISFSVMMFTVSYMNSDENLEYFTMVVVLFIGSMNILIFFPNLLTLLLGWDGLGLTSYLLVIYYKNSKSLSAGMVTALTNRIGDALLILAVSWSLISFNLNLSFSEFNLNFLVMLMVILASMTKSAQMPFSSWLPEAMAAPTPVSALVHSSTLVTAGVYLIIRFFPTLNHFTFMKFFCFYLGVLTCLMASTAAIVENDIKKIIALSTLSQLGIMMMTLGLEQPKLAFFHLITHALFKAMLFICAGAMIHMSSGNQDIRLMGKLNDLSAIHMVFFNVANLSLCGIPFLAGFYSKDSILETFFIVSSPLFTSVLLMLTICLTGVYTMRLLIFTLWSEPKSVNYMRYCSINMYIAYITLYFGAIMGGANMNWVYQPIVNTPVLPLYLKLYAIFMMGWMLTVMFWFKSSKMGKELTLFLSTMWFLKMIFSNPINSKTMNLSQTLVYNESTLLESLSGGGVGSGSESLSKKVQVLEKVSMSETLSIMLLLLVMLILMGFSGCH